MKHQLIDCFMNGLLVLAGLTVCFMASPLAGQDAVVKRHPGDHLHYTVTLADGDINKIVAVNVGLQTTAQPRPDQEGGSSFGAQCQKSSDPKIWTCDVVIPTGTIDGDYRLSRVGVGTPDFGKSYTEDFHLPVVPIQNPNTFTPPSKVVVTQP